MSHKSGGVLVALIAGMFAGPGPAGAQDTPAVVGTWAGTLDTGAGNSVRIVFHLAEGDAGSLDATMDSPDQGAFGIAAGPVTVAESSILSKNP